ncbi:hypothetical protein C8R45DRAFT_1206796 [Mycena sanguinolenta]|nr:hypothetical protein C8R45DRAFT_1206796 [Mycena sanguinolenta]
MPQAQKPPTIREFLPVGFVFLAVISSEKTRSIGTSSADIHNSPSTTTTPIPTQAAIPTTTRTRPPRTSHTAPSEARPDNANTSSSSSATNNAATLPPRYAARRAGTPLSHASSPPPVCASLHRLLMTHLTPRERARRSAETSTTTSSASDLEPGSGCGSEGLSGMYYSVAEDGRRVERERGWEWAAARCVPVPALSIGVWSGRKEASLRGAALLAVGSGEI